MALHGLAEMNLGTPCYGETRAFYQDFGLTETSPGRFSSLEGGHQLTLTETPYRRLVEFTVAADDADDLARIRANATARGLAVEEGSDGSVRVVEPLVGIGVRAAVKARIEQREYLVPDTNNPGHVGRDAERSPAIFNGGPARPKRLGHVLYTTPDLDGSMAFLTGVFGFRLSDWTKGLIAFMRCGTDHHNVGLINAPVTVFHHSSWQVNDVDEIGQGAQNLLTTDPKRSVWGLGRHFLGSNYFWYFRDPAGNYAEYFADLDQITNDDAWVAKDWDPSKSLYAWGPPVPPDFVFPPDAEEVSAAFNAERNR